MNATYVYAIIPTGNQLIFDVAGVDGDHGGVHSVPHHDIAAVVSASPLTDYRGLNRKEAAVFLVAHQRVVETVMQEFPVLPVKFGTVLPDEAWIGHLLTQGEMRFRTALERFAGQVQMEVVVLWDLQGVFAEIGQEESIVQLKAQIAGRPPEETRGERIAIGQLVHSSLERRRDSLRNDLLPSLRQVAQDLVINPPMDESMVVNVALLVDRDDGAALDRQLELLDEEFEGRLYFRCVGPLPPYSFAATEVVVPSFQAVDKARRRLGLAETVPPAEIKCAYRRLAGQFHPDHSPDDPDAASRMAELTQAYELLNACAESQALAKPPHQREGQDLASAVCRLDRQTVEQTLLIAVRRQKLEL